MPLRADLGRLCLLLRLVRGWLLCPVIKHVPIVIFILVRGKGAGGKGAGGKGAGGRLSAGALDGRLPRARRDSPFGLDRLLDCLQALVQGCLARHKVFHLCLKSRHALRALSNGLGVQGGGALQKISINVLATCL